MEGRATDWELYYSRFFKGIAKAIWKSYLFWRLFGHHNYFLKRMGLKNPRILELGSGTGLITYYLLRRCGGGSAVLVDRSRGGMEIARSLKPPGFDVTFVERDIFDVHFSHEFDLVFSDGVMEHFTDRKALMQRHVDSVKRGGFVLVSVPHSSKRYRLMKAVMQKLGMWIYHDEMPMQEREMEDLMAGCGLRVLCSHRALVYQEFGMLGVYE